MRSRRVFTAALIAALLLSVMATGSVLAGDDKDFGIKKRVIVGTFVDKSDHHWYHGNDPGSGMADMLITALVKSGKFKVFERMALQELLDEKGLNESDLASPAIGPAQKLQIGDFMVKATITEFGYKEKKIGGSLAKGLLNKAGVTEYTARVAVDLRIINIGTSEIVLAESVDKSEKSRSLGVSTDEFSFGSENTFDEHVVGKATRKVINEIVEKVAKQTKDVPWTGLLIVADEFLFIDAGTELGIKPGMEFEIKRKDKEVKHPKTGKILKVIYTDIGTVKATEVEEGVTTCKVLSGSGFQSEDFVVLKKK